MTHTAETNAKFFPQDSLWQRHCEMVVAYLNSIPPVTSKPGWDGRDDRHQDFLATSEQHARNVLNGDV